MTTSVTGTVTQISNLTATKTGPDNATGNYPVQFSYALATGDVSKVYHADLTVNTTASIDLTSVTNQVIGSETFAVLKIVQIINEGSVTLTVGGGTNGVFNSLPIPAGGSLCWVCNQTVDSTHKIIALSSSSSCACQVLTAGT